jgi:hypothetical protein
MAAKVVSLMFGLIEEGKNVEPSFLVNYFGEDISRLVCESMFLDQEESLENKEKIADDCIQRLKNEKLRMRKHYLHNQIKSAQDANDQVRLCSLIREFDHLIKNEVTK